MAHPLRILILDDSEDDVLLLIREIKKIGKEIFYEHVETESDFSENLKNKEWDLILTDYSMPGFSGLKALEYIQNLGIDTPRIMVSGKMGEESAVEAMRYGADDYILKDNLTRLIPAINRELKDFQMKKDKKKTEEKLKKNSDLLKLSLEATNDALWDWDINTGDTYFSPRYFTMLGYEPDDFPHKITSWQNLIHPDDSKTIIADFFSSLNSGKDAFEIEYRVKTKNNEWKWILGRGKVFERNPDYTPKRMIGTNIDVTERMRFERQLAENEEKYRTLFENAPIGIFSVDKSNKILEMNPALLEMLEIKNIELNKNISEFPQFEKNGIAKILEESIKTGIKITTEIDYFIDEKKSFTMMLKVKPVYNKVEGIIGAQAIVEDISMQKKTRDEISKTRDYYLKILDDFPNPIRKTNSKAKCDYFNKSWLYFTGKNIDDEMGTEWSKNIHSDDEKKCSKIFDIALKNKESFKMKYRMKFNDGTYHWVSDIGRPIYDFENNFDGYIGSCYDINDLIVAEEKIKVSLEEKDILLKEIHHRVKNNLQIISSLIGLQLGQIEDPKIVNILRSNQDRIRSMALVHESLYQSGNFANIDFGNYLKYLVFHLIQSYGIDQKYIKINLDIGKLFFKIDTAIPLGLLINELITNCIKHAFSTKGGNIFLELNEQGKNKYILKVKDDGVGFPKDFDIKNVTTFGLTLINNLVLQINGNINLIQDIYNEIIIDFSTEYI